MSPDIRSYLMATALLYVATPLTVWALLRRRYRMAAVRLWGLSGLLLAAAVLLYGLLDMLAFFVTFQVSNALTCVALALKFGVLRGETRPAAGWPAIALACAASVLPLLTLPQQLTLGAADALANLLLGLWAAAGAAQARQVAAALHSRSAGLISALSALMTVVLLLRAGVFGVWGHALPAGAEVGLTLLLVASGNVAALGSNVAFVGLALDRLRIEGVRQQQALDALREAEAAKEAASRTRAAVAHERARTTRLLADEVRQPLHNAAVALQMGATTLAHSRDPADAARAIGQAQAVLRRISATLDNTVAVATQLVSSSGRVGTAETDLQMLVELCLGDLAPEARERVQLDYRADARSAMLEPTLVRLAMRNLLTNALQHSPPDAPVQLRVLDSDDPLALVIEVSDQGNGIPDALRQRIIDDSTPGTPSITVPGDGLGLHVVKRVARLHGGSIEWRPNRPHGSVLRLTLPQGDPG
jgi:signal transduction histidine kinase